MIWHTAHTQRHGYSDTRTHIYTYFRKQKFTRNHRALRTAHSSSSKECGMKDEDVVNASAGTERISGFEERTELHC